MKQWLHVSPSGGILLKGIDDLAILAKLTDEALLPAQTTAVDMRAGKLDHLGEEGSKFSIYDLQKREIYYKSGVFHDMIFHDMTSILYHNISHFITL